MRFLRLVRWLLVAVVASAVALVVTPTLVTAAGPGTGFLEVCKASDGSAVTGTFRFTVAGQTIVVPVGACSAPLQLPAGVVTVVEEAVPGVGVVNIGVFPADRVVSTSIASRSAQVNVVPGGIATQTIVTFTNRSELGVLTVCKVAGSGVVAGTSFTFVVAGRALAVPAGECAAAGTFPHGTNVTVAEVLEPITRVSDIAVIPPARIVGAPNVADGVVTVAIGPGVTQVTFTNEVVPQGFLQICKRSDSANMQGTFTFTVAGQRVDVPVGSCSSVLRVPEGIVTVTELPRAGSVVSGITTAPSSRLAGADLPGGTAQVRVVAGNLTQMATVTFTNTLQVGQVKVCKVAGPGVTLGAPFSFAVAGQTVSVPAGSCVVAGTFAVNSVVNVTEALPAGMSVSAITVNPPERMSGSPNLGTASVAVVVGPGVTEVSVVNRTITSVAPTTSTVPTVAPSSTTTTAVTIAPIPTTTTSMSSTSTIPLVTSSTTVPASTTTSVPLAVTTTTVAPVTTSSTTSTSVLPLTTTSITSLTAATTSTTAPPPSSTSTTSVAPVTTTSTIPPSLTNSDSTTVGPVTSVTTSSTLLPFVGRDSTTVGPATTATTVTVADTSTSRPCVETGNAQMSSTTTTTPAQEGPVLCSASPLMSTPTTIVGQLLQQVRAPVATVRLALTGARTSVLLAVALAVLMAGAAALLATARPVSHRRTFPGRPASRRYAFARRSRFSLSSASRSPRFPTPRAGAFGVRRL